MHKGRGHPLQRERKLVGDIQDYLRVFCHIDAFGEGISNAEIVQIGATLEDDEDEDFFAPVLAQEVPKSVMKSMGFQKSSSGKSIKFDHPDYDKPVPCEMLEESLEKFAEFLIKCQKRSDRDGVVLVFPYMECLTYLMRALSVCGDDAIVRKFSVVIGFGVLEPMIRHHCLSNYEGKTKQHLISLYIFR